MSARDRASPRFVAIDVLAQDREPAERAAAEAYAAGATGLEERDLSEGVALTVYAPAERAPAVRAALRRAGVRVGASAPVPDLDWSEHWKRELTAIEISPRLLLRPSFDTTPARPGQRVLTIDPGQAFGTGGHESTRLALECLEACVADPSPELRVLDVGTGTGVLALAALSAGCRFACAFDVDPLAGEAAQRNARRNRLAEGLAVFVGSPAALADTARFELVLANLLWSELRPLLPALALCTRPGGRWVMSGLLEEQLPELERAAAAHGLHTEDVRHREDASGARWTALVMRRAAADP